MSLSGKRVLVTGATGFIGSHLVKELVSQGADVVGLVFRDLNLWRIQEVLSRITLIKADIGALNYSTMVSDWPQVDVVYHLGATGINQIDNDENILKINVLGTEHLFKWAMKIGVKRFVYCGSCAEYSRGKSFKETDWSIPLSIYGVSKATGTFLAQMFHEQHNFPVVCLRLFTVYGPYEDSYRLIPTVIQHMLEGKDLELTPGEQIRDFIFVKDVVDAFIVAGIQKDIEGEIFNIATGNNTSIRSVVEKLGKITNTNTKIFFGAKSYRLNEPMEQSADISKTKAKLNWEVKISLEKGLKITCDWFEKKMSQPTA